MKTFAEQLTGVMTAAIAGHIRPDGDCAGSCLATYNYIKNKFPAIDVTVLRRIAEMNCGWETPQNILKRRKKQSAWIIMSAT